MIDLSPNHKLSFFMSIVESIIIISILETVGSILKEYESEAGVKINADKLVVVWLGS